jgi:hypothetical protein
VGGGGDQPADVVSAAEGWRGVRGVPEHIRQELKERVFADVDQCRCALRRAPHMFEAMTFEPVPGSPWLMRWVQWADRVAADELDFRRYVVTDRKANVFFGQWCFWEPTDAEEDDYVIFMPSGMKS